MGWLERISNINKIVDGGEDLEKILEQTVLELEQHLINLRQGVAGAIRNGSASRRASLKRTERQLNQNQAAANQWYSRAQLALRKGDEMLARSALHHRQPYLNIAKTLQTQIDQQLDVINKLRKDIEVLESQIATVKMKKNMYIASGRDPVTALRGVGGSRGR